MKYTAQELLKLTRELKTKELQEPREKEILKSMKAPKLSDKESHDIMMEAVKEKGYF